MQSNNDNLIKMVEMLNDQEYHDGTSIGNKLNITRAAVWKAIKKLEQFGIDLQSTKGKGYQLISPLILLNHKKIKPLLHDRSIKVDILEKTGSTNEVLKENIKQNKKIKVCMAELQTQGKGRLSRQWHSPYGKNIYLSMLYPLQKDISELSGLSLVIGLATCHAIESALGLDKNSLSVKWPNDIIVNQCKLAGTLIEIQAESNGGCQMIIGIGINVNMQKANAKDINQPWTSLLKLTNNYQDRNRICAELINHLIEYMVKFSNKGLSAFIDEWNSRDYLYNKLIGIMIGKDKHHGICVGINEQGHILLKDSDDSIKAYSSGDATLIK